MNILTTIRQHAAGRFFWQIVDAVTGQVVRESPRWIPNLILNDGMERVAANSWCSCFTYGSCGTGTTSNSLDSGLVTASQTGTTVTASSSIFVATDANNGGVMIKWDSGEEARVTGYTSATQVTVTPSQAVGAGQFTIWRTNQVGLVSESKRSNTYLTGSPHCTTTRVGGILTHRRTYDFTAEVGIVNYTEVGVAWSSSGSSTHFSRVLLPAPVPVGAGQQLRLVYELILTLSPTVPNDVNTNLITNWPWGAVPNSYYNEQMQLVGMSKVNTTGATTYFDLGEYTNEAYSIYLVFASSTSTALSTFGSSVSRSAGAIGYKANTLAAYTPFNFYRDKLVTFNAGEINSAAIRCFGIGSGSQGFNSQYTNYGYLMLFDNNQEKPSTHTLSLTWRVAWSRDLA
jgi:hypothetical protein